MGKLKNLFFRRKTHLTRAFTRSTMQSNLHFNRSGLSRPCPCSQLDTTIIGSEFYIERCHKRRNGKRSIGNGRYVDECSCTVVKHLHKRRVFSLMWKGGALAIHGRKKDKSVDDNFAGRDDTVEDFLSTKDINREQLFEERNMQMDCDGHDTSTESNLVFKEENERDRDIVLFDLHNKEDLLLEEKVSIQLAERKQTMGIGSRSISKDERGRFCSGVLCDLWNSGVDQKILFEEKENTQLLESQDIMSDTNKWAPHKESMQATPLDVGIYDFRHDEECNDVGHLLLELSEQKSRGSPENNLVDEFIEQSQIHIDLNTSNNEVAAIKALDVMNHEGNKYEVHTSHNIRSAEDDENMFIFPEMNDTNNKPDRIKHSQHVELSENREVTIERVSQNAFLVQNESNSSNNTKTSFSRTNKLGIETSGSFNYRRLLPYLVTVNESNLGVSENGCSIDKTQLLENSKLEFCRQAFPRKICAGGKLVHDDDDSRSLVMSFPSEGILSDKDCQLQAAADTFFPSSTSMCGLTRVPLSPDPETDAITAIHFVGNWEDSNPIDISDDLCDTKGTSMVYNTVECGIVCKESNQIKSVLDMKVPVSGNLMPGSVLHNGRSIQKKSKHVNGESASSSHKSKYVLDPCSRVKLLKTPGSISYKRLLPYMVDGSKTTSPNGYYQKIKKQLEENLNSRLFSDFNQPLVGRNIIKESSQGEQCKDNLYLSSSDLVPEQDCQSRAAGGGKCSTSMVESSPWCTTQCSLVSLPSLFGNANGDTSVPCKNSFDSVRRSLKPMVKQTCPSTLADGSIKGILKVYPAKCRGLCTCFSCVSFRQRTERELDITKSQMQETNHVAFDLINQLFHLLDMLEKSISVSDDSHALCMSQVKKACRKAYEVGESAKIRISQLKHVEKHSSMKRDSRRRVRFADYVEERVIL